MSWDLALLMNENCLIDQFTVGRTHLDKRQAAVDLSTLTYVHMNMLSSKA